MPSLTWLTRDDDVKRAGTVPYRLLEAVPALSHGDPVAGTGWLDTFATDRRMMLSAGPFTMEPGDSQEKARAPLCERLWRNQLGILLAVALTAAAAGILMSSYRG